MKPSAEPPLAGETLQALPSLRLAGADAGDLASLVGALRGHLLGRPCASAEEAVFRATCLPLLWGHEVEPPSAAWACSVLEGAEPADFPEARVSRLWLAVVAGETGVEVADELEALARRPLWRPVHALALRGMVQCGRRLALAGLLPSHEPLSLEQADAWLDATHATGAGAGLAARITAPADDLLPAEVRDAWMALLRVEADLAEGTAPRFIEGRLAALLRGQEGPPRTWAEAEGRRIAARATAARVRTALSQGVADSEALTGLAVAALPPWESEYLRGLALLQLGRETEAADLLRNSLRLAPGQTCVRLALAVALAPRSPEEALQVLEHPEPTRQIAVARAALLARLQDFAGAEEALTRLDGLAALPEEAARCTAPPALAAVRRQEAALRTALAERRRDWPAAEQAWTAGASSQSRSLQQTRRWFMAGLELADQPTAPGPRRAVLEQQQQRAMHELEAIPLGRDLFFRAAACARSASARAIRDFETLLQRRGWVEAQRRVGGGRLVAIGDFLLRLGQPDAAARAYELAGSTSPALAERLAVALVSAEVLRRSAPESLQRTIEGMASGWPRLLAAVGLLAAGKAEAALALAESCDAPEAVCRAVRQVCSAVLGRGTLTREDIAGLHLPPEAAAVVEFLSAGGSERSRLENLVQRLGADWQRWCPIDLEVAVRRLLTGWCDEGRWDEALGLVDRLAEPWAAELATLVRLRRALDRGLRGDLELAERELAALERRQP